MLFLFQNNFFRHRHFPLCFFFGITLFVVGCHRENKPANFPAVAPCHIIVQNGSVPIPDTTVILFYDSLPTVTVTAITNAQGVAKIRAAEGNYAIDGAPLGKCRITVKKIPVIKDTRSEEEKRTMTTADSNAYLEKQWEKVKNQAKEIPGILGDSQTTPLTLEIVKPETVFTIDISPFLK
jgi:hypothetical protein